MTIQLEIPGTPLLPNKTLYSHWRVRQREAKKWKGLVHAAVLMLPNRPDKPFEKAKLTLVRCSARRPDMDNLIFSCKYLVDALKHSGVIVDDNPDAITAHYFWEKEKQKLARMKITVEAA